MEAQLRLLRAQLDPHMLFNSLANVRSLVREDVDLAYAPVRALQHLRASGRACAELEAIPSSASTIKITCSA